MNNSLVHPIFLRAYAVAAEKKETKQRNSTHASDDRKWPEFVLVFDTETRIAADQSLIFGVYRLCRLEGESYVVTEEGIFFADDLPAKERKALESYMRTAIPAVASFPPPFPLHSPSPFINKPSWP